MDGPNTAVSTEGSSPDAFKFMDPTTMDQFQPAAHDPAADANAFLAEILGGDEADAGTAPDAPEPGTETAPTNVSGDGTPAGEDPRSPFIPRARWDQDHARMKAAEEKAALYESRFGPLERRGDGGTGQHAPPGAGDPLLDHVPSFLAPPAAPQSAPAPAVPTEPAAPTSFEAFVEEQFNLDAGYLEPHERAACMAAYSAHQTEQRFAQMQQQYEQGQQLLAERQAQADAAEAEAKLGRLVDQIAAQPGHEVFQGPTMRFVLQEAVFAAAQHGVPPRQAAQRLLQEISVSSRNQLAQQAINGTLSSQPPSAPGQPPAAPIPPATHGGAAPSPALDPLWMVNAPQKQFDDYVVSLLRSKGMD